MLSAADMKGMEEPRSLEVSDVSSESSGKSVDPVLSVSAFISNQAADVQGDGSGSLK